MRTGFFSPDLRQREHFSRGPALLASTVGIYNCVDNGVSMYKLCMNDMSAVLFEASVTAMCTPQGQLELAYKGGQIPSQIP